MSIKHKGRYKKYDKYLPKTCLSKYFIKTIFFQRSKRYALSNFTLKIYINLTLQFLKLFSAKGASSEFENNIIKCLY